MVGLFPRRLDRRYWIGGIACAYAALTLAVVLHHEPWRDEADVWLAARDMTPGQLWYWLRYVGSPGLWYAIVIVPAKLGWPYGSMGVIHWALAVVTASLVLFRAPFPLAVRVLVVFSYLLGYEYAVIARSYVLTALLMVMLAIVYPRRLERPIVFGVLLALLFNTNVHGGIIAGVILVVAGVEAVWSTRRTSPAAKTGVGRRRAGWRGGLGGRVWVGVAVACVGAVVAAAQLLPGPADGQLQGYATARNPRAVGHVVARAFLPQIPHSIELIREATGAPPAVVGAAYGLERVFGLIIFGSVLYFLWRRHRQGFWILVLSGAGLCYLFTFKWMGGDRHSGLFWLLTGFVVWIAMTDRRDGGGQGDGAGLRRLGKGALLVSLVYSTVIMGVADVQEWRGAFSGAEEVAGFLRANGLAQRPLAAYPDAEGSAVLPYLPGVRFYYLGLDEYGTCMPWNQRWVEGTHLPEAEVMRRLAARFPASSGVVLVTAEPVSAPAGYGLVPLFQTRKPTFGTAAERYFVYGRGPLGPVAGSTVEPRR